MVVVRNLQGWKGYDVSIKSELDWLTVPFWCSCLFCGQIDNSQRYESSTTTQVALRRTRTARLTLYSCIQAQ